MRFADGISEIVLRVKDVKAAAKFYQEVVGLVPRTPASDTAEWVWFWAGEVGQPQTIAVQKGPLLFEEKSPLPEGKRWGQVHFAFKVSRDKLEEAAAHVRSKGVEVFGPAHFK
ncbi:MAG: VOC family protein [Limisphaerales bacterium]